MGRSKEYRCSNCGYNEIVTGGTDAGISVAVETHVCKDCLILTDVVTSWFKHENPGFNLEEVNKNEYACTECDGHNVVAWDTKRKPCPKCGAHMDSGKGIEVLWD